MKKCKHNRLKDKLRGQGDFGRNYAYCTQCQEQVYIYVTRDALLQH